MYFLMMLDAPQFTFLKLLQKNRPWPRVECRYRKFFSLRVDMMGLQAIDGTADDTTPTKMGDHLGHPLLVTLARVGGLPLSSLVIILPFHWQTCGGSNPVPRIENPAILPIDDRSVNGFGGGLRSHIDTC